MRSRWRLAPRSQRRSRRRRTAGAAVVLAATTVAGAALSPVPAAAAPSVRFDAEVVDTNLVRLDWEVTGGNSANLLYIEDEAASQAVEDAVGFRPIACRPEGQDPGCSTSFRVPRSGVHRYTLSVRNDAGETVEVRRAVTVRTLPRPRVATPRLHVDMLDVTGQTLSWTPPPRSPAGSFVQVRRAGSAELVSRDEDPTDTRFGTTGSLEVPAGDLELGSNRWSLSTCVRPDPDGEPLCGPGAEVTVVVGPAEIPGAFRRFVPAQTAHTVSWGGSGTLWHVSVTRGTGRKQEKLLEQWVDDPRIAVPAALMTPGVLDVAVTSCVHQGECSNRVDIRASTTGRVTFRLATGGDYWGNEAPLAVVTPEDGGPPAEHPAARIGRFTRAVADGAQVRRGDLLGYLITPDVSRAQLVVGGGPSVVDWTRRRTADDFAVTRHDVSTRRSVGSPLDITFDADGGVWSVGEFGTAVAQIEPDGDLTHHEAPLARVLHEDTRTFRPTKPFRSTFGTKPPTSTPALVERVIDTGSAVWWAQGGGYSGVGNHSRLIRFDRRKLDDRTTPRDERLCAVHVPGDDNQVMGLAYDARTRRIWFSEKAADGAPGDGHISWFVDGEVPCSNELDYQDQTAVDTAATATRCDTPAETDCITRIDVPKGAGAPGHLIVDADGSLWINSWSKGALSRYTPGTGSFTTFPLPQPVRGGLFEGNPWQIRVDADAVYLIEYADNQLLRFDRGDLAAGRACTTLTEAGRNPCVSELFLPMGSPEVASHSIDLSGGKLWFTVANEARGTSDPDASVFGWVDVASWADGRPQGVLYDDLSSLGMPPESDHHSVRGIDVTAAGRVALAEMGRELLVLEPR